MSGIIEYAKRKFNYYRTRIMKKAGTSAMGVSVFFANIKPTKIRDMLL